MNSCATPALLPYQTMDSASLEDLIDSCNGWTCPEVQAHKEAFIGEKMRRLFKMDSVRTTVPRLDDTAHRPTRIRSMDTPTLEAVADSQMDNSDPFSLHILEDCVNELIRRNDPSATTMRVRWRIKIRFAHAAKPR